MAYKGGTRNVKICIERLKELNLLIDVYSNEWLAKNHDFCDFYQEDLVDYQNRSKGMCAGHLLIISTAVFSDEVYQLLTTAHPPLLELLGPKIYHKPDIIFINLATQQILCAGLARKNYFYGFALGNDQVQLRDGDIDHIVRNRGSSKLALSNKVSDLFMQQFCKYDYAGLIPSILESLYEFGCNARAWDSLPLNPELIQNILNSEPLTDGMYAVNGDFLTLDELNEILQDFAHFEDMGNEHLHTLQIFFPELNWGDLNTQDY